MSLFTTTGGGANSDAAAYEISNSLMFSIGGTSRLTRAQANGNQDKWTWSGWVKRSTLGAAQCFFATTDGSATSFDAKFDGSDRIDVYNYLGGGFGARLITNRVFRDTAAWYHIVVVYDSGNSTEAHRLRIYVNGTEESSFSTTNYPSQNEDSDLNVSGSNIEIGRQSNGSQFFDGYMAEMFLLDGQAKAPTDFAETDDNGVWIPKDCSGDFTFGTNGFYLEFKQTGASANASGMGADTSGNDNHFTPGNLGGDTDVKTDTPTNNFCTFNPLSNLSGVPTLSEGNCIMSSDGGDAACFGTFAVSSGKWYWELKGVETDSNGVQKWTPGVIGEDNHSFYSNRDGGYAPKATALYLGNSNVYQNNSSVSSAYFTATQNDYIGVAFDADNNKIYWHKNGTYGNSGDPTSGATGTGAISTTASHAPFVPIVGEGSGHEQKIVANFGNSPYPISSGNADANGYGNFEYAVPSGYFALCTKNLAENG